MDRRQAEAEIVKVWNNLIDPTVAAHAQPTGIHNGTLFVTVDSSTWLSEIVRYRRKEIIDRLQNTFGKQTIAKISFTARANHSRRQFANHGACSRIALHRRTFLPRPWLQNHFPHKPMPKRHGTSVAKLGISS